MSRYAKTMAVLRQGTMELEFSEGGKLSAIMEGKSGGGESIVSAKAFSTTNATADAEAARMAEFETAHDDGSGGGGKSYEMAEVNTEKTYEQIRFTFEGYTDTADAGRFSHLLSPPKSSAPADDDNANEDGARTVRVRYKSNGTCRPYRVKVSAEGDNAFSLTVAIDMLGAAKVEEDEK